MHSPTIPPPPSPQTLAVWRPLALVRHLPAPPPPPAEERSEERLSGLFPALVSLQRMARREMLRTIRAICDEGNAEAALEMLAAVEQYLLGEDEAEAR